MRAAQFTAALLLAFTVIIFSGCGSNADSLASEYFDLQKKLTPIQQMLVNTRTGLSN